ncbi:MAG: winged helix DNA-binding domain-containing protein, partial [Actinomycetota bacterium]|nr:winged helix DNA-binding domain-containing protein [Actinomycetota bacterium]
GIGLRDARAGLKAIAGELREREDGLVEPRRTTPPDALPPPRLLGGFEPVLLGWVSREQIVGPHGDGITMEGIFRSFAMIGGRAVATWRMPGGKVELDPLEPIAPADLAALEEDAEDVRRFLGA